jgi:hypothetical protein
VSPSTSDCTMQCSVLHAMLATTTVATATTFKMKDKKIQSRTPPSCTSALGVLIPRWPRVLQGQHISGTGVAYSRASHLTWILILTSRLTHLLPL